MLTETPKRFAPIETRYKGYRFRSRLEARWAVFFDKLRVQWQYEPEGFNLGGECYLPDFFLPTLGPKGTWIEVKPAPLPGLREPFVYMAGRMRTDWRPVDNTVSWKDYGPEGWECDPRRVAFADRSIVYTGPFSDEKRNHDWWHGVRWGSDSDKVHPILTRSMQGIDECDVFFAWFGDREAFGTLVELGYAKAKGKTIVCAFDPSLVNPWFGNSHDAPCGDDVTMAGNDLWFAAAMADHIILDSVRCALAEFGKWLRDRCPPSREQHLAWLLSEATGARTAVVYGDPYDVFRAAFVPSDASRVFDGASCCRGDSEAYLATDLFCLSKDSFYDHAETARRARFEHGAVP